MKKQCIIWFGQRLRNEWMKTWQREQEVCSWLARDNTVIYVERLNAFNRNFFKTIIGVVRRFRSIAKRIPEDAQLKGLRFISLMLIPFYFKWFDRINSFLLKKQLLWHLHKVGTARFLLCISNPSKFALMAMKVLTETTGIIYQCTEHYEGKPDITSFKLDVEMRIAQKADFVIVHSKVTMAKKRQLNNNTFYIPEIADSNLIKFADRQVGSYPDSLCRKNYPKICYLGSFHHIFDFELVRQAACCYREYRFLLWGPITSKAKKELESIPNIKLLGLLSPHDIIFRLWECDVCLIPYIRNEYSRGVFPHKLFAYLASGRPIVASRLPEIENFKSLVFLADNQESFIQLLGKAVNIAREPEYMHFRATKIPKLLRRYSEETILAQLNQKIDNFL